MPLDPSIILQGKSTPPNPLETVGQALALKNALIQNESNQQTLDARNALGQVYQGAIDPTTGQLDANKLMAGAASNPATAWMAGDLAKQAQDRKQQQVETDTKSFDLQRQKIGFISQSLGPLALNPNSTPQDYMNLGVEMVRRGIGSVNDVTQLLATMPKDPATLQQWGIQHYAQTLDAEKQLELTAGKVTETSNGAGTVIGLQNLVTGVRKQTGFIANGLSPAEATSPAYTAIDEKTGAGRVFTKGEVFQAQQNGTTPVGIPTSLPLGEPEARNEVGLSSGKALVAAQNNLNGQGTRLFQLHEMLSNLSNTTTGPGTQALNNAKSFFQALDPNLAKAAGINANDVSSYDQLNKYMTQYAQAKSGQYGQATDAKLASALTGNPNTHISGLAAAQLTKAAIALESMDKLQMTAWRNAGLPKSEYLDWAAKWSSEHDPRALLANTMTPSQFKALAASIPKQEQGAFAQTLADAHNSGVLDLYNRGTK